MVDQKLATVLVTDLPRLRFAVTGATLIISLASPGVAPVSTSAVGAATRLSGGFDPAAALAAMAAAPAPHDPSFEPAAPVPAVSDTPAAPAVSDEPDAPVLQTPPSDPVAPEVPQWRAGMESWAPGDDVRAMASSLTRRWGWGRPLFTVLLAKYGATRLSQVPAAGRGGFVATLTALAKVFDDACACKDDMRAAALDMTTRLGAKGYAMLVDRVMRDVAGSRTLGQLSEAEVKPVFSALYAAYALAAVYPMSHGFSERYLAAWDELAAYKGREAAHA